MKTIADILKKNDSTLSKLINKAKFSQDVAIIFRTALDSSLTKHCHFANYKDSVLTVVVANAATATRLRFAIPDIIKQLRIQPEFKDITNIRYTLAPIQAAAIGPQKAKPKLSKVSEELWQKTLAELRKNIKHTRGH